MQGEYRIFFDFMETMGFVPDYVPKQPYQSWGTEFVVLVEDSKDFLATNNEQDWISKPIVVKHWRQDWKYQDSEINALETIDSSAVYQVIPRLFADFVLGKN